MIKQLLRKHLLEYKIDESQPMIHFKDRVFERITNIREIQLGHGYYLPFELASKEVQDAWIIKEIKESVNLKVNQVLQKDYPIDNGVCVLVPLGKILVKPLKGQSVDILLTASGFVGSDYYMSIYDNRVPTIVLADPKIRANANHESQLAAHIKNSIDNKWPVNYEASFIDISFDTPIIIRMSKLRDELSKTQ
jgi:hypothetical protein